MAVNENNVEQFDDAPVGDLGTQLFYFNSGYKKTIVTSQTFAGLKSSLYTLEEGVYTSLGDDATFDAEEEYYLIPNKFEYALPVTAGAEFGGDTESFEAPETDLDYVRKVGGRRTNNDIAYTSNYTKVNYKKAMDITDPIKDNTYMEILRDGSAMIFKGTCAMPSITGGDVRQIGMTIIPSYIKWVSDVSNLTEDDLKTLDEDWYTGTKLNIDKDSIPEERQKYFVSEKFTN